LDEISTTDIGLTALFASLYAIGVISLAPISFTILQVRIADTLIPLTILFGPSAILGIFIGTLVSNAFGGLGMIDILGGSIANLASGFVGWRIGQKRIKGRLFLATIAQTLILTLVVGTYLPFLLGFPLILGWASIFLGSAVSINLLGYSLLRIFFKPSILMLLRSKGIRIYGLIDPEESSLKT